MSPERIGPVVEPLVHHRARLLQSSTFAAGLRRAIPVLVGAGCALELVWAERALPHKYVKRSSDLDLFIYFSGGPGTLLRGRHGLLRETVPCVLPPSRSPLWPSVCRTDHPEECHIMSPPPHNSPELEPRRQSSHSVVSLLVSSHKGLQWLCLLLD